MKKVISTIAAALVLSVSLQAHASVFSNPTINGDPVHLSSLNPFCQEKGYTVVSGSQGYMGNQPLFYSIHHWQDGWVTIWSADYGMAPYVVTEVTCS